MLFLIFNVFLSPATHRCSIGSVLFDYFNLFVSNRLTHRIPSARQLTPFNNILIFFSSFPGYLPSYFLIESNWFYGLKIWIIFPLGDLRACTLLFDSNRL